MAVKAGSPRVIRDRTKNKREPSFVLRGFAQRAAVFLPVFLRNLRLFY